MSSSMVRVLLCAGLVPGLLSSQTRPRVVHVVARDYALEAPDSMRAGKIGFELENRGTHFHELMVGLMRPGATAADIVAAHQRGVGLRQLSHEYLAEGVMGALLAEPGTKSAAQLVVSLAKGRDYVLLCQLRDSVGKPPHAVMGMFKVIHAR